MRKYEFTGETKTTGAFEDIIVKRIRAIVTFESVKTGDLGGWIEKDDNLSEEGNAWVYGNAEVYGNAKVYGDARVCGDTEVCGDAEVYGDAEVCGNAKVCGNAWVYGNAEVYGNAKVCGNAEVCGNAKVCGNAEVCGNAKVCGDARVYGNARVCGDAEVLQASHLLVIGPIGSRSSFTTFFRNWNGEITVKCGCFLGKIDQFLKKVQQTHGESKHAVVYRACVEIAKMQIGLIQNGKEDDYGI